MAGDREYVPASNQSQSRPPQNQGDLFGPVPAAGIDRQAHIGPQAGRQVGRDAGTIPPGGEHDAQDGADHVDSHRSLAFIASPYAKRNAKDSTFYSTPSVLRTIELILGLNPMTQFDAAALPMWRSFTSQPEPKPYEAVRPKQAFDELNPAGQGGQPRRVETDRKPPDPNHLAAF